MVLVTNEFVKVDILVEEEEVKRVGVAPMLE